MKKITISFLLLVVANVATFAQDYKKVRSPLNTFLLLGTDAKLEEAKNELDKLSSDPKAQAKAETFLLATEIYGSVSMNNTLKDKYPQAAMKGLESLKKYLSMEPTAEKFKEDNYVGVNAIYNSFFDKGYNYFKVKSWDSAYTLLKPMVEMGDIMVKNKWTTSAFDTTAYKLAGIAAQNANKEDDAIIYYEKMAGLKIKGEDVEHIYVFLPQYYSKRKNELEFKKHIVLGKEVYPDKPWDQLEFEYITGNFSPADISQRFDDEYNGNSLTAPLAMNYGDYFMNDKKLKELKPEDKKPYTEKAAKSFIKAYELDAKNVLAIYNAAVINYVLWGDADDAALAIRGITADIKNRRAQADKVAMAAADKALELLEKAYKLLDDNAAKTNLEKNSEKNAAKFLANLYLWKRDKSKGKPTDYDMYDKKFQSFDKKY